MVLGSKGIGKYTIRMDPIGFYISIIYIESYLTCGIGGWKPQAFS